MKGIGLFLFISWVKWNNKSIHQYANAVMVNMIQVVHIVFLVVHREFHKFLIKCSWKL